MAETGNMPILKGMKIPSTSSKCARERKAERIVPPSLTKPGLADFCQNGSGTGRAIEMGAVLLAEINGELCARPMPRRSRHRAISM